MRMCVCVCLCVCVCVCVCLFTYTGRLKVTDGSVFIGFLNACLEGVTFLARGLFHVTQFVSGLCLYRCEKSFPLWWYLFVLRLSCVVDRTANSNLLLRLLRWDSFSSLSPSLNRN